MKKTKWEQSLVDAGIEIITWEHEVIMDYLLSVFNRDVGQLLLKASLDNTKRRTLEFFLDDDVTMDINIVGSAIYNKKLRRFTHLEYSDKYNWMVQFSITSKVAFFSRDFYNQIKHVFPFGHSVKNLTHYLMQA